MSKILLFNSSHFNNQKGVTAVLIAMMLPVLIGVSALAIDVGYMYTKQNELQNIADAAALAACRHLGEIYTDKDYSLHGNKITLDEKGEIQDAAKNIATIEEAEQKIIIASDDIIISTWPWTDDDPDTVGLAEVLKNPDCVRVTVRLTGINTFLARVFSLDTFDVKSTATAVLSGRKKICDSILIAPVGVSLSYIDHCDSPIEISNLDTNDCAGWYSNTLTGTKTGDDFLFTGTTTHPSITNGDFLNWFNSNKTIDNDGDDDVWTATVVVYDDNGSCTSPNGNTQIVGFAKMPISNPSVNNFFIEIICDRIITYDCDGPEFARGAGGIYGNAKGYVPNLVQSGQLE
ncbi:MAG: pilus assembly protein TadG-related protein [Deltaproteobacteria bacterium]|jgi:hypothetical protein|nr:pilus assembly protein TadG-related protein [Deltaproteobacteria bacterium]